MRTGAIAAPRELSRGVLGDVLPPAFLALWVQVDVWGAPPFAFGNMVGPRPAVAVLYAVTSLALIWRKRAPLAVLAFVVTAEAAEYLTFGAPEGLGSFLPPLFAFYCVGRYLRPGLIAIAAPLVLLGTAVGDLTDPAFEFNGSNAFFWLVLASAWPIGQAFQKRATEASDLAGQARALAEEHDERARAEVEAERKRIARELHDVVGHGLSVIVLQLVGALAALDKPDLVVLRERLTRTENSARDALAEMRRLLDLLDDGGAAPLVPQPGLNQLDRLLADANASGAQIDLAVTGQPLDLPAGVELAAFRILQESLTNVLKHAHPPRAHVQVHYEAEALCLQVSDEGLDQNTPAMTGRGHTGMRERVALYGGELELRPGPNGYSVRARLPVRR